MYIESRVDAMVSPTHQGKVEKGVGLWSPIGDSPFGNRLRTGRQ